MEPEKKKEYENKIMVLHKKRLNPIFTKKKKIETNYKNRLFKQWKTFIPTT